MTSIILGLLIFGYAGWMLFRFVKKSKKGACASCPTNVSCSRGACSAIEDTHKAE